MAVTPINSNMTAKRSSYLSAAGIGVVGGLIAQYAIPVSKKEYDTFVSTALKNGEHSLTKDDITVLAKAARSSFDFAVVTALALTAYTFFKNIHNKNKLAQK